MIVFRICGCQVNRPIKLFCILGGMFPAAFFSFTKAKVNYFILTA